nr:hypothetical protein GCM10025699_42670 [Microbacterium flavescens]
MTDVTGNYEVPMFIVGFFLLLSAALMVVLTKMKKPEGAATPDEAAELARTSGLD